MTRLPTGLYDLLHTRELHQRLQEAGLLDRAEWAAIDHDELPHRLVIPLTREVAAFIAETIAGTKKEFLKDSIETALQTPEAIQSILKALSLVSAETLQQIKPEPPLAAPSVRPDTPLSVSALLTGTSRSPALRTQLIKELATCDRADWIVSFIKYSGIVPLLPILQEFTRQPAPDERPRLRIATTSYMGATDLKAINVLLELPNTEIRISYDTKRTRLHAKAYLFHRATGFGSAYIGSANISKVALDEGLEWTAKISQYETEHLWRYAVATFESHWEDSAEFTPCHAEDLPALEYALSRERGESTEDDTISFFDLRPYGYQQAILEDIAAERQSGKHKHLVIAATGTGKTMIAAFDYKGFCSEQGGRPSLLFVAHREEILRQARDAFRQVLRDGSFGDFVFSGANVAQTDHLFCTLQSWNSRGFNGFEPHHFNYVVLDEAHHASADSYQKLIDYIKPHTLLGLTATPERLDGKDIRQDFDGAFTHEIRLPEAIERALLCPFHYYGIPDLDEIDFSALAWKRGGYDITQLRDCLEGNQRRAEWVMSQTERYVADIKQVPFVPSGCIIHLEKQAQEYVLKNIRAATANLRGERLLAELRQLRNHIHGEISLQNILDFLNLDSPDEIFKRGLPHVLMAKAEKEVLEDDILAFDAEIAKGFRRLSLMDDPHLILDAKKLISTSHAQSGLTQALLHSVLWNKKRPQDGKLEQVHSFFVSRSGLKKDLIELLDWLLQHRTPLPRIQFTDKTGPLVLHASYTREQVMLALGLGSFEKPKFFQEGVLHVPERRLDVFFADINKSEVDFSPTTMYEDYAVTERLFHWQSQSRTGENTATGQRYINHQQQSYTPMLFIRNKKRLANGLTAPYLFAGPLIYRRHEGSRPMSIIWDLVYSLPARVMTWARVSA